MAGATEDPSLRVNPFLPWPPQEPEPKREDFGELTRAAPAPRSVSGFSLGLAASERSDWTTSARVGLFHERYLRGSVWLAFGADGSEELDQATGLSVFVTRIHASLKGRLQRAQFRPTYRAGLVYEWAEVLAVGASFDRYALLASVGFEAGPRGSAAQSSPRGGASRPGRWWAEFEYLWLLGKSGVEGEVFVGFSLRL